MHVKVVFICGPWGSGTSLVAELAESIGLAGLPPYFASYDPRTVNTFESNRFRALLMSLASEETVSLFSEDRGHIRDALSALARELADAVPAATYFLKHALACLVLPELAEVFDARFVFVARPLEDIERSRARRNWPLAFGEKGAVKLYAKMFDFFAGSDAPILFLKYPDLLRNPAPVIDSLIAFCDVEPARSRQELLNKIRIT